MPLKLRCKSVFTEFNFVGKLKQTAPIVEISDDETENGADEHTIDLDDSMSEAPNKNPEPIASISADTEKQSTVFKRRGVGRRELASLAVEDVHPIRRAKLLAVESLVGEYDSLSRG